MKYILLATIILLLFFGGCSREKSEETVNKAKPAQAKMEEPTDSGADSSAGSNLQDLSHKSLTEGDPDVLRGRWADTEESIQALADRGEKRQAAEICYKLSKIYAKKKRYAEFYSILKMAIKYDPTYGPPHCLLANDMDMTNDEGRQKVLELCKQCVKYASKEYTKGCEEILKKYK